MESSCWHCKYGKSIWHWALCSSKSMILLSYGNWKYSHNQRRTWVSLTTINKHGSQVKKKKSLAYDWQIVINSGMQEPQPDTKASRSTSVQEVLHMGFCLATACASCDGLDTSSGLEKCVTTLTDLISTRRTSLAGLHKEWRSLCAVTAFCSTGSRSTSLGAVLVWILILTHKSILNQYDKLA